MTPTPGNRFLLSLVLVAIACIFLTSPSLVRAEESAAKKDSQDWYVEALLYAWLLGVDGNVKAGPFSKDLNADFKDLLENLDGAIAGRVEGGYKDFAFMIDAFYSKSSSTSVFGPNLQLQRGAEIEMGILDFGMYYLIFGHRPLMKDGWSFGLEAFAGGRWLTLENSAFIATPLPALSGNTAGSTDFLHPEVGARLSADLIGNLFLSVEGLIGGFGLEGMKDWTAQGTIGYGFFQTVILAAGYKAIGFNYNNEQFGSGYRALDVIAHGPVVTVGVHF